MNEYMETFTEDTTVKLSIFPKQGDRNFAVSFSHISWNVTWESCSLLLASYNVHDFIMENKMFN